MTREEWLNGFAVEYAHARRFNPLRGVSFVPSFPRRNRRRVVLGEWVRDHNGRALGLVSPLVSDSVEVAVIVAYLSDIRAMSGAVDRVPRWVAGSLAHRWDDIARGAIMPNAHTLEQIAVVVADYVRTRGEYPHEFVPEVTTARQSTRLLRVSCAGIEGQRHEEYVLRMSRSQLDRGAPWCGVCSGRMIETASAARVSGGVL